MANADGSATPDEQHHALVDSLERAVSGALHRVEELKAMPAAHPDQVASAEDDVKTAKANLAAHVKAEPKKARSSRPKKAKESR